MKEAQKLKERICLCIDRHREDIIALGEDIRRHPELGFKEYRTADLVAERFRALGIAHRTGLALTGVKGVLPGRGDKVTVAYLGELDSVLVSDHPDADPETGAAHACGHHAQIANLVALAHGLVESGAMERLDGGIALMAVPAEEYVELAWRLEQRRAGRIEFLGGKPELVRLGAFDEIGIALMTHQASREEPEMLGVAGPCNGCVVKLARYRGRAAHAGGGPHRGVNALKAAMLGLQAIDANRETFQDEEHIRVHPIITCGGELVNVVPADVRLETFVRGATLTAITGAAAKVDRSLRSGALAMGATLEVTSLPGYLPRLPHEALARVYLENAGALVGRKKTWTGSFGGGSTDMGDLSHIMPAIEASANGCRGQGHGADYLVRDPEAAYIIPAKAAAMTLVDLLSDGADRARRVIGEKRSALTKAQYLSFMRKQAVQWTWNGENEAEKRAPAPRRRRKRK